MKKARKIVSVFLSILMIVCTESLFSISVQAGTTLDPQKVVDIALSYVGGTYKANYCLAFVKDMFVKAYALESTSCCAYNYGSQYIDSTNRNNIPKGADVFFGGSDIKDYDPPKGCGNYCGHIGICVGDDYIVHAWSGKIVKMKINDVISCGYPYRGWGWHGNWNFGSHTHNFSTLSGYQSAHPHYAVYKCSCGQTQVDKNKTQYDVSCEKCLSSLDAKQTISDGDYIIASGLDHRYCINVMGGSGSKEKGQNIHLWNNTDGDNNALAIVTVKHIGSGYYSLIFKNTGMAMDVTNYGHEDRTNVAQWTPTNNSNQRWVIKQSGDGYYFNIVSKCNGLYVDAAGGTAANETNIQMYHGNGTKSQKWRFLAVGDYIGQTIGDGEYYITSALSSSLSLDVQGSTGENMANVQVWNNRLEDMDTFKVEYQGKGCYKIYLSDVERCLDLENNNPYSGSNVQLYDKNTSTAQQWIIKFVGDGYYNIISKSSGLAIDSTGGNKSDGNNIQAYLVNSSTAQKWRFIPVKATKSGAYNGHKYEYYKCKSTFAQAFKHCERLGGHLVTINSKEENDYLVELTTGFENRAWIGGTSYGVSEWNWIKPEEFSYENWAPNQPSDSSEICIDMYLSGDNAGTWNDELINNGNVEGFICEYDDNIKADDYKPVSSKNYNGHQYEFFNNKVDWQSAKKICEEKGGYLVTIEDSAENSFISQNVSEMGRDLSWIGYTDLYYEGNWIDINGNPLVYTNWLSSNPDNDMGFEDYAVITTEGQWGDLKSVNFINWSIGFICEYDKIENTTEPESTTAPATEPVTDEPSETTNILDPTDPTSEPSETIPQTPETTATEPGETQNVTDNPTEVSKTLETAPAGYKRYFYLPSEDDENSGYEYMMLVHEKSGEMSIWDLEATDIKIDGVKIYFADIPEDKIPTIIQYQVYSDGYFVSNVTVDASDANGLDGKIIKYDGLVFGEDAPEETEPYEPEYSYYEEITTKTTNSIKATAKTKTVKAKKVKKKAQTVKPIAIKNAQGTIKVTKVKSGTTAKIYKKIKVNSKTGAITFKKGKYAKKTYKIRLKITVSGNSTYKSKTLYKTVKVRIK